jgi:glycosyltransferase involved in cell wall biosynthesis
MDMLTDVLRTKGRVERIGTLPALWHLLLSRRLGCSQATIIIYTSLLAPFILLLKLIRPSVPVYYMVRGDEVTYVKQANRYFRAFVATVFQKLLNRLGCHFVFVCEDLLVLFEKRLGHIRKSCVLPNTLGKRLSDIRPFDGRIALVGDFDTVKNIEWAIDSLSSGKLEVHLYGNRTLPEKWRRGWLHAHGIVQDLTSCLRDSCSLVVFPDTSAGLSNVVVEALEAGCGVVVHREFPFKYLPISAEWRFDLYSPNHENHNSKISDQRSDLECVLDRLLHEKRDFKKDNPELIELIESDWEQRVWEIFS